MSEFTVQVGEFQGPLSVLLEMVEKRKLDVSEVSLAVVADEFMAYVQRAQSFPREEAAQFIVIAATLLLLKSRALLPTSTFEEENEASFAELERRLALHQVYALGQEVLEALLATATPLPTPKAIPSQEEPVFAPGTDTTLDALHTHLQAVVNELPQKTTPSAATLDEVVSIKEMMHTMLARVQAAPQQLAELAHDRAELVVAFLALLELVKDGALTAAEDEVGTISIMAPGAVS